jgi:hypothetical protein
MPLKQVKNYYLSKMGQDHLNGFATLNINSDLARKLDFLNNRCIFREKGYKIVCTIKYSIC